MNFTVVACYRGPLEQPPLQRALVLLQGRHPLLRSTLHWDGHRCRFAATDTAVPLLRRPLPDRSEPGAAAQAWKPAAMASLRRRFAGGGEPLWRITWLAGNDSGQLLFTFHHAIADGLPAMALVQQLFSLLAAGDADTDPGPPLDGEVLPPELSPAPPSARRHPEGAIARPERRDIGLSTGYVLEELEGADSGAVLAWTRRRGLRLNATLHAAFLQALVAGDVLPALTTAGTVVNLRHLTHPPLPWELMRLLRVCVETPVRVDPSAPLEDLAAALHGTLQQQLADGVPFEALRSIATALEEEPTPRQFWERSWRQGGLITNLGRVPVDARHGDLTLERLFFVANIEPIALPEQPLAVLGALTFRERLCLTCFHIEQQLEAPQAASVLAGMKQRLLAAALP